MSVEQVLAAFTAFLVVMVIGGSISMMVTQQVYDQYEKTCAPLCLNTTNTVVRMLNGTECWCMDGQPAMNATSGCREMTISDWHTWKFGSCTRVGGLR